MFAKPLPMSIYGNNIGQHGDEENDDSVVSQGQETVQNGTETTNNSATTVDHISQNNHTQKDNKNIQAV